MRLNTPGVTPGHRENCSSFWIVLALDLVYIRLTLGVTLSGNSMDDKEQLYRPAPLSPSHPQQYPPPCQLELQVIPRRNMTPNTATSSKCRPFNRLSSSTRVDRHNKLNGIPLPLLTGQPTSPTTCSALTAQWSTTPTYSAHRD